MKVSFVLCLISALQVAAALYSQDIKLNVEANNQPLLDVLRTIENQSDYRFFFSDNYEGLQDLITLNIRDEGIDQVMADLLVNKEITYKLLENGIIVITPVKNYLQQKLSGKVTDASTGESIPGVYVKIEGTNTGSVTDAAGKYSLLINASNLTIVFSCIGYITERVVYEGQTTLDVNLVQDIQSLEEVVVVGYGTTKKRDLIGSVSTVKSNELTQTLASSFSDVLQGRAAGVLINTTSGQPGSTVNVNIRGLHSINSGSDPLWVIDGMPVYGSGDLGAFNEGTAGQNALATINPNDIESIEVLKDAAATAIYGSRGSNGVILVTTKLGKADEQGSIQVDFSTGFSGLAKPVESMNFVNTKEWFEIADMSFAHSNEATSSQTYDPETMLTSYYVKKITREEAELVETDWFDYVLRTGSYSDINVSLKQGFNKGSVFSSIGYRNDKGVSVGNDLQRVTGRINTSFSPTKNLDWGMKLNLTYSNNYRVKSQSHRTLGSSNGTIGGFGEVTRSGLPWLPVYDEEDITGYWNPGAGNYALASNRDYLLDQEKNFRGIGGIDIEYHLPWIEGLSIRSEADFDMYQDNTNNWTSSLISNDGTSYNCTADLTFMSYNYNTYLKYNKTIGQHGISFVLGTESQKSNKKTTIMEGTDLTGTNQEMGSSSPATMTTMKSYVSGERYIRSFFLRSDYKFKDRYIVGVSARRDGSSVFDVDYRWGNFYALSMGWILSEEKFFTNFRDIISLIKIRGSIGQTGNQDIPNDKNLITINYKDNLGYGPNNYSPAGVAYSVGNKSITWETTNSYDFGIDFGLLNNRISGSAAYYLQDVTGMLLQASTPPSASIGSIYGNLGEMKNWGFEFNVSSTNVKRGNFTWITDFNFSTNRNKILELTEEMESVKGSTTYVGGRLGLFYAADYAGIDPERGVHMIWEYNEDIYAETGKWVKTGRKIPYTNSNAQLSHLNRVQSDKSYLPTYFGGIGNAFRYKGFELNVFFTFSGGNYIYNLSEKEWTTAGVLNKLWKKDMLTKSWKPEWTDEQKQNAEYPLICFTSANPYYTDWDASATDPNTGLPGWWTNPDLESPVNTTATETYDYPNSKYILSKYLEKGDYLRLKTLTLAYYLRGSLINRIGLDAAKIYVSATNLWTLTGYSGFDPEIGHLKASSLRSGDSELLPSVRTISLGANLTF